MLHSKVRRFLTVLALVLVLASACPALAAPGPRTHATPAPVSGLSLLDKLLDWLGLAGAEGLAGYPGRYEKSTTTATDPGTSGTTQRTGLGRGVQIDPNG